LRFQKDVEFYIF